MSLTYKLFELFLNSRDTILLPENPSPISNFLFKSFYFFYDFSIIFKNFRLLPI